ncbi:hypothetical protein OG194_31905 [Streptomyces sp. NBC_01288]|uniref:hypothetical protein n=1 Tax=Streptomyces sp. NBC_01288 TaxID=2903814 RepID=UPI002E124CC9|nr:hypothetical protein OG194_31905 [Streptomyces sp. NBC_01288]
MSRHESELRASRGVLRGLFSGGHGDPHLGLAAVIVAGALVGFVASPVAGAPADGAFTALSLAAPTTDRLRLGGIRGAEPGAGRPYVFAVGPGQRFQQRG